MVGTPDWAGWADTGGSDWTLPLDPKTRHVGPPWGNQNNPVARVVLQLLHHVAQDGCRWKARFSHDRLSASTAHAWGSGTGDTNCGSLLLNLVANRSTCGWCHQEHIALNTSG